MPLSETSKIRATVWPWIRDGRGIDLGCGHDRVHPDCPGMDRPGIPGADIAGDITDLSRFPDASWDWVYSSHALEDIPDTEGALREWLRVLKPGGHLIVYCPYRHYYPNHGTPGANPDHVHDFTPSDILAALRAADPDIWFVTAEVRGKPREDEFHEYSFLVIVRKGRPEAPRIYIGTNPQIGDTLSAAPLCAILRRRFPGARITLESNPGDVLDSGLYDDLGRKNEPYDLIVHQWTRATEFGDWLRRTTHFSQFTARACAILLPEIIEDLPADSAAPVPLPYRVRDEDRLPDLPDGGYVVIGMETHPPRRWDSGRWHRLIRWLIDAGHRVVILGRGGEAIPSDVVDLRGRTTVRQAAAVIERARLLISVDTVLPHLAEALGVPAVVLNGPSAFALTFQGTATPVTRPEGGCAGCYNWASAEKPFEWHEGAPRFPIADARPAGRELDLYVRPDCREPMSGVECLWALRLTDVIRTVAPLLGAPSDFPEGLTAAMIVRNESDVIVRCLDSLAGLADAVVLVDTGSSDDTTALAAAWSERTKIPLEVGRFDWINDFAAARNHALSLVRTRHLLWLDADEIVEDPAAVRSYYDASKPEVLFLITDMGDTFFRRERIVPTRLTRWTYPVHECLEIDGLIAVQSGFRILHRPPPERNGSLGRNRIILEKWLERDPGSNRALFYMAETLRHEGDGEGARDLYSKHYLRGDDWNEALFQSAYQIARLHLARREWSAAAHWGLMAIRADPAWREGYYAVGDAYFWMGLYEIAYAWFLAAANIPRPKRLLWMEEPIYGHLCATQLSYCCERLGRLEEAVTWAAQARAVGGPEERVRELEARLIESRLRDAGVRG